MLLGVQVLLRRQDKHLRGALLLRLWQFQLHAAGELQELVATTGATAAVVGAAACLGLALGAALVPALAAVVLGAAAVGGW
jgi:hypothetical protein